MKRKNILYVFLLSIFLFGTLSSAVLAGEVVDQIKYSPTQSSFSSEVTQIKNSEADGVIIVAFPEDAKLIFSEAKSQNLDLKWFGTDGIASTSVTNESSIRDYLDGRLFGTTPSSGTNPGAATLFQQYLDDLDAIGGTKGIFGDYAYDAVLLAAAAVKDAGSYDGVAIRNSLYKVANGFKGATGENKAFDCNGEPIEQSYDYWKAENGAVATLKARAVTFSGISNATTETCFGKDITPGSTVDLGNVVKIGFLYPKTGGLAPIAQGLLDGARAAAYRINQSADYSFDVVLVAEDSGSGEGDIPANSANALASQGIQVIVGAAASAATLAAANVLIPKHIPLISYASTSPAITDLDDDGFVFRVVASDVFQGKALARLADEQGVTKAFVINRNDAYGNGVADEFSKEFKTLGEEEGGTGGALIPGFEFSMFVLSLVSLTALTIALSYRRKRRT